MSSKNGGSRPVGGLVLIAQAAGMTVVVTKSSLFRPFREHGPRGWQGFVSCQLCVGVWIGIALTLFKVWVAAGWPPNAWEWAVVAVAALGNGAIAGALALFYAAALECIDAIASAGERFSPKKNE